jgi:hypothetical protein
MAMKSKANIGTENYHQSQVLGEDQTVLTDQHITGETDEMDPAFYQQSPPRDPEDEDDEDDDDDFPAREDIEEDDFDLDQDDDVDLDEDDQEFK